MKRERWYYVRLPGVVAAKLLKVYNKEQCKEWARGALGVTRLPKGVEIWLA